MTAGSCSKAAVRLPNVNKIESPFFEIHLTVSSCNPQVAEQINNTINVNSNLHFVSRKLKCYPWAIVAQFENVTRHGHG